MNDRNITKLSILQISHRLSFFKRWWRVFSEAVKGSDRDYTEIPLNKAVFLLAVPMVLEMAMESIFAIVDIFFVSSLGADAIATVGITESVLTLIYAIAFGLAMGTNALVSRRVGEKHYAEASSEGMQAIITGIIISLLIAVPGLIFAKDLLRLMGASPHIITEYSAYPAIMYGGNIVIMLLFINNAIFRGAGDAAIAMRVLWIANGINLILDPLLIFGIGPFPEMGIAGAAIATNIGRGTAVAYQFYILFNGKARVKLGIQMVKIRWLKIVHLLNISYGGILQSIIATTSWVFMVRIISHFGSEAVAGYTIAIRIIIFLLLPSWGLSNAASTLVGQNLGANRSDRAEQSVWKVSKINVVFLGVLSLFFIVYPEFFIRLFTTDANVVSIGADCLRIVSYGFIFYGLGMVLVQSFNGAGDTRTPTIFNLVAFWMIEIPLAYLLAIQFGFEQRGVFYAIIIAESSMSLMAWYFFRKGKWKTQQV
ncbi:MAG: MATE family efflux transporter [Salinivirgaceae bacterium]|nr:MATE family efflux transporter [Salinivirgaceae bacterium]